MSVETGRETNILRWGRGVQGLLLLLVIYLVIFWALIALPGRGVDREDLAGTLQLSDLSIWSSGEHVRHPAQVGLFTPFRDWPSSPDTVPEGCFVLPGEGVEGRW